MRYELDRALHGPRARNLQLKAFPVEEYHGDSMLQRTPPYINPANDAGVGGGGGETATVIIGGVPTPVWALRTESNLQTKPTDNAGYAQPALSGTEGWFPNGMHSFGRTTFSKRHGVIVSSCAGVNPNTRRVEFGICAFGPESSLGQRTITGESPRWRFVLPASESGLVIGWDRNFNSDLVVGPNGRSVHVMNDGTLPATRGAQICEMPFALYETEQWRYDDFGRAGFQRVHVWWRQEWWVLQITESGDMNYKPNTIWRFNTQTGAYSVVGFPQAVRDRLSGGNLSIAVDEYNQRIFAIQQDATPPAESWASLAPALIWQIDPNPATPTWTQVSGLGSVPNIRPINPGQSRTPFVWMGGIRFHFMEAMASDAETYGGQSLATYQAGRGNGGIAIYELQIPTANAPRRASFTKRSWEFARTRLNVELGAAKHQRWAFRSGDGRLYVCGGDWNNPGEFSNTESGRNEMWSLVPEDPNSVRKEQPYCTGAPQPWNPDEVGWIHRPASDDFWYARGYEHRLDACSINSAVYQGWGGNNRMWRWSPASKAWINFNLSVTSPTAFWPSGESCTYMTYDPTTDRIFRLGRDGGAGLVLNVVNCANVSYQTWHLASTRNRGGSIDGFPVNSMSPQNDYHALDPATGYLYWVDWYTRNLFRVDTRAGFDGSSQYEAFQYWVNKVPVAPPTENMLYMAWLGSFLVLVVRESLCRARVFTWKEGEATWTEHPTPWDFRCNSIAAYQASGSWKLFCNGTAPFNYETGHNYFTIDFS
jgi:hypothetical protein